MLVEALYGDRLPASPAAALHSQVARLRRVLGDGVITSAHQGYALRVEPGALDAANFEELVADARRDPHDGPERLGEALGLWRGPAYGEFAELEAVRFEAVRLDELRLAVTEERFEALAAGGRATAAIGEIEAFVAAHPLRERARGALMRALYAGGRHADALRHYAAYREHLADELGLEPSAALQRLELDVLRHGLDEEPRARGRAPAALDRLQVRYLRRPDGRRIAVAEVGEGPPLVVAPAWVSSLDLIAAGRDPRASLLERLARGTRLTVYDRAGTGLSRGGDPVTDHGLEASTAELEVVLEHTGPAAVLGISQSGPVVVALAARRPDLVSRLVLFGTYADGPVTFPSAALRAAAVGLVRAHPRTGTAMLAGLYRPGAGRTARSTSRRSCASPPTRRRRRPTCPRCTTPTSPRSWRRCTRPRWCCTTAATGSSRSAAGSSSPRGCPTRGSSPSTATTTCPTPPTWTRSSTPCSPTSADQGGEQVLVPDLGQADRARQHHGVAVPAGGGPRELRPQHPPDAVVARQHPGLQRGPPALLGRGVQRGEQLPADAAALPVVDDLERELGGARPGPDQPAQPDRPRAVGGRDLGDEREAIAPVQIEQRPAHRPRQPGHRCVVAQESAVR